MNNDVLFVYGSLLDSDNEFGQYLMNNSSFVSHAVFKGRLFDRGEYPGAVADVEGYKVKGSIYKLNDLTNDLTVLDDYEGYGIEQEQPNLFVRQLVTVVCDDQTVKCWIYLYNLSTEGLTEITSGDYVSYLKSIKKSLRGFRRKGFNYISFRVITL